MKCFMCLYGFMKNIKMILILQKRCIHLLKYKTENKTQPSRVAKYGIHFEGSSLQVVDFPPYKNCPKAIVSGALVVTGMV
ncbi:hypothetical protein NY2A_b557R [Paramecium bursaria Chlorella virus NY2A]|uniref:Uncharacterized protein b557R n=1 Tax=Paramecium bursaria Chlorella virus NY2A TaxID=46021 RepID=A7IX82_PBCVN|nr:hypothetical protein NY2A_b557R [Paramecium bursaria Chlorella virus NY2A]ABT14956.1 hypothetical protein NY2A_b557R [Paramecium bursaria Chlorella virus NY2A]